MGSDSGRSRCVARARCARMTMIHASAVFLFAGWASQQVPLASCFSTHPSARLSPALPAASAQLRQRQRQKLWHDLGCGQQTTTSLGADASQSQGLPNEDDHGDHCGDGDGNDPSLVMPSQFIHAHLPHSRRSFWTRTVQSATVGAATAAALVTAQPAAARGLVEFPCVKPLLNNYHLMRAGASLLEEEDIWSTNPLFLTNRESALSSMGVRQVEAACEVLRLNDINPSVVKYSLAASAMDTVDILKQQLEIGQNRLIPEFTFMDPRAIGKWDMLSAKNTRPALFAMDAAEAKKDGSGARPPANDDGTPNETLADQKIRLVQLMSVLETQFSGDTVVLVFPDGSSPALLSAMMAGVPLNRAHEFEFQPGEIRLDVTMESAQAWLDNRSDASKETYEQVLVEGQAELERLRSINSQDIVSKKDQKIETERIAVEKEYLEREQERKDQAMAEDAERLARRQELDEMHQQQQQERLEQIQQVAGGDDSSYVSPLASAGILAGGAGLFLAVGQNGSDDTAVEANANGRNGDDGKDGERAGVSINGPDATGGITSAPQPQNIEADQIIKSPLLTNEIVRMSPETMEMFDGLSASSPPAAGGSGPSATNPNIAAEPPQDPVKAAKDAMDDYLDQDDGGDAWLQMMGQLATADDEDDMLDLEMENPAAGQINSKQDNKIEHL